MCFVQGPEGSGKAINLLYWVQDKIDHNVNEKEIIIPYFVRENCISNYFCAKEIIELLNQSFEISFSSFHSKILDDDEIKISLLSIFDAIDYQLKIQGKTLILVLPSSHLLPSLNWLPDKIPSSIRIFVTSKLNFLLKNHYYII